MRIRDAESMILNWLWPVRPSDAPIVGASAIAGSVFWAADSPADAWLGLWVGTSLGLLAVLMRARRRARRGPRSFGGPTVRAEAVASVEAIDRPAAP
jgi:hypothetical protein